MAPPPSSSSKSPSSSFNVSYETFAPRSTVQISRLSRIAALTGGPTNRASANEELSSADKNSPAGDSSLFKAMSLYSFREAADEAEDFLSFSPGSSSSDDGEVVHRSLLKTARESDHLTHLLKHATSLRLALRASINIAEDISNRHAALIRHSSELSAAADRLQEEEAVLSRHAEEIGMPLKHYDAVDNIGVLVGVLFKGTTVVRGLAKVKVDNEDYTEILDKIDDAVAFFSRESGGKAALDEELKRQKKSAGKTSQISGNVEYYRRSLALQEAALYLIREAVVDRIASTTAQVASSLNISKVPIPADKLEASLVYTRFHGISSRSNRLLTILRKRLHHGDAYHELLHLCRNTYCNSRESLLKNTIQAHMEKLKEQHGLAGMTRLASVFLIRLCTVETALYLDFFGDRDTDQIPKTGSSEIEEQASKPAIDSEAKRRKDGDSALFDSEFQHYLSSLCSSLHRTVRRGLVTLLDLDTLCQIVSVLREERSTASSSPTTTAAARAISSVIADAQERLIFCATNYLTKNVIRFKPTPNDLDYPAKLGKDNEPKQTSQESDADAVQKQLSVYESWFPPIRSILHILSKIFRVVEPRVFEDIALQSVQACTKCLKDGARYIEKRKGTLHSDLFLVKHLLILREQLSPFDIELRSVERQLDFSDAGKAVSRFLANRNRRLFSMSTQNALVTLLREGVSVADQSIDSKRDLEDALRTACTDFIEHTCNDFAGNLVKIVEDCKTSPPIKAGMDADSLLDLLTKATERLEVKAGEVISQMALYLDNSATQSILLKPSIRKITKALEEVRKLMSNIPDGEGGWDESKRGKIFMLIDELEQGVKSIGKGSVAS